MEVSNDHRHATRHPARQCNVSPGSVRGRFCKRRTRNFFGLGPVARLVAEAPYAGLGFIEAHGLAFILGILMWRAQPARGWHLAAAAIHALLGTANLVFWQLFIVSDMLLVGYVTTALHGLFVVLQMSAAISARMPDSAAVHAGPVSSGHR